MMTEVHNLSEIITSIPPKEGDLRKFNVILDQFMLVDLEKAAIARTFPGKLVFPVVGATEKQVEKIDRFIEIFWTSGLSVVTMFTPEIERKLRGIELSDEAEKKEGKGK